MKAQEVIPVEADRAAAAMVAAAWEAAAKVVEGKLEDEEAAKVMVVKEEEGAEVESFPNTILAVDNGSHRP